MTTILVFDHNSRLDGQRETGTSMISCMPLLDFKRFTAIRELATFIFFALGGLGGLACIFVWLGIKPEDLRMTPTWPHVAWLIVGLFLFALSIGTSVWSLIRSTRGIPRIRREHEEEVKRVKAQADSDMWKASQIRDQYKTEKHEALEQVRELKSQLAVTEASVQPEPDPNVIVEQNRLVGLGRSVDGLLNPLQIRVISLRKELMEFVSECGPFPEPPNDKDRVPGLAWSNKFVPEIVGWAANYSRWSRKLNFGYRERFAPEVLKIVNEIGAKTTINIDALEPYVTNLRPREEFSNLIAALQDIAWKLDPSAPFPDVNRKITKLFEQMTADELLAAIGDPTLKRLIDETPAP
jgi:hypothetical protein